LRIINEQKDYFPLSDSEITLHYSLNGTNKKVRIPFKEREPRSHLLKIGQQLISDLKIKEGSSLSFIPISKTEFTIEHHK
jgi:hypothetical protein